MTKDDIIISGPEENYEIPKDGSVGKYIIDCLKRRGPDEIVNIDAVTGESLTCGELLSEVIKYIHVLKSLGVEKGDVVTVISENTIKYCVPIVAGLYTGVVLNLLNPVYSVGELRHALSISKPKLVLSSKIALPAVLAVKPEFECIKMVLILGGKPDGLEVTSTLDVLDDLLQSVPVEAGIIEPEEFDASQQGALILLSSGTSGLPKGVLLTHSNLRIPIGIVGDARYPGASDKDVVLAVLPFSHVFGITVQFSAIVFASKLVVMSRFQPDVFLRGIQQYRITLVPVVPPIILFLAKHPMVKQFDLSSVRYVLSGAAALGKDVQEEVGKVLSQAAIGQAYGITEISGSCAILPPTIQKPGSVGKLIPNLQLKVWDSETCKTVGPNELGEFWFKGPMVMKRYLGIPTTEDIIDKDGFYHSGDVGYYDEEGYLYLVDRIKDLIKYKGFQVPPTELENILLTHPLVKDCAVIGVPNVDAGEVPVAYIVRQSGSNITENEIKKFVAERISFHKHLHGGVKFIDEVPRSTAGKLLRKDLLQQYLAAS